MTAKIISSSANKTIIQIEVEWSGSMLDSEKKLQSVLNDAGKQATGQLLTNFEVTGEPISWGSVQMTSKGKVSCAYQTPYGEIVIDRHVYQTSKGGKTFCPLENNARIITYSTPMFAKQISHKYAEHGAERVVKDLKENHGRTIAKSFVQNLAETVASVAQLAEETWEYRTPRQDEKVVTVSIGIDGANMLTVEDGWRQAMVGTISLFGKEGNRLHTTYVGATPEYGKETFIERMEREITQIKSQYPLANYIGIADGARDNWPFLRKHTNFQILDFYHATEYLTKVADAVYGAKSNKGVRKEWLDDACHKLKHNITGPSALILEMKEFKNKKIGDENRQAVEGSITYFTNHKKIMKYAEFREKNFPIGSGVTESACKLIIKQRLCCSGMRWRESGAAAVLSLRTLSYTEGRWGQFWQKIDARGFPNAA